MADKEELIRFGVAFPAPLIEQFDQYIDNQGYKNRSEAFRDLARKALLDPPSMKQEANVAGTIVMVYDHHVSELPMVLMELQHDYHREIISNMHVHLNHDQCLEVIVVRGNLNKLRELHQQIQVKKGVLYAELSVTYADERLSTPADDHHAAHSHPHSHGHKHDHGHQNS